MSERKTILLVEDEALIALCESELLKRHGYNVVTVATGEDAVRIIIDGISIDLVLMDIDLGQGIDGTEAALLILEKYDIPIVFLSSHTEPAMVERTDKISSYGYIVKTSGDTVLLASIRMAFRLYAANREIKAKNAELEKLNEEYAATLEELEATNEEFEASNEELIRSQRELMEQERIIRESEGKYRLIFEHSPLGVLHYDRNGVITVCNDNFVRIVGSSREVLEGLDMKQLPDGKLVEALLNALQGVPGYYEDDYRSATAEKTTPVQVWFVPMKSADNEVIGGICITEDETERKRAENENRRFREMIDASLYELYMFHADTLKYSFVSEGALRNLGYTLEEIQNITSSDIMPEYNPDRLLLVIESIRRKEEKTEVFRTEQRRKDGSLYPVEIHLQLFDNNRSPMVLAVVLDITSVLYSEEIASILKESEEKYRAVVDNTSDYIMRYDRSGRHLFGNNAALDATGVTLDEYVGKSHRELGFPDHLCAMWEESIDAVFTTSETQSVEFEVDLVNGKKYLQLKLCPEFSAAGDVKSVIGISRDITERRMAEEKVRDSIREKKLLMREMHHRIKNNLNVIMGLLSLQSNNVKEPLAAAVLNDAKTRLLSMSILYDKLYNTENTNEISVLVYLTTLINEVVALFPNGGSVKTETDIDDFVLDSKKLSTLGIIVNELITNTMKHAFNGGPKGVMKLSLQRCDDRGVLVFEDNGVGIPDSVDVGKTPGFGLQLVNRLSRQMKRTVRIERDSGTRFVIDFQC